MNDPPGLGGQVAVGVDVGHDVVAEFFLVGGSRLEIDVVEVGRELAIWASVMFRPSSFWHWASASQRRRQVENFRWSPKRVRMAKPA